MEEVVDLAEMFERVLSVAGELNATHDLDILLDKILLEARRYTRAEAGSIFLVEGDNLRFCYVQNDAMALDGPVRDSVYVGAEMPLDQKSLAGYAACTASSLVIDDAYHLPADVPYKFNRSFDEANNYRTVSVLVAPLVTGRGKVVGVLQIINAKDQDGQVVPFSKMAQTYVGFYAGQRGHGGGAGLHQPGADPAHHPHGRTQGPQGNRGPMSTGWQATPRKSTMAGPRPGAWSPRRLHRTQDLIRVAAMLHDVGKVAVSDTILQKPGRLDVEEYHQIKFHTVAGAKLFRDSLSDLDQMALEIALNHHERWDGNGYPGPHRRHLRRRRKAWPRQKRRGNPHRRPYSGPGRRVRRAHNPQGLQAAVAGRKSPGPDPGGGRPPVRPRGGGRLFQMLPRHKRGPQTLQRGGLNLRRWPDGGRWKLPGRDGRRLAGVSMPVGRRGPKGPMGIAWARCSGAMQKGTGWGRKGSSRFLGG